MHRARFKAERRLPSRRRQPPSPFVGPPRPPRPASGHPTSACCTLPPCRDADTRCSMQLSFSFSPRSTPLSIAGSAASLPFSSFPPLAPFLPSSRRPESSEDAPSPPRILTYFCGGGKEGGKEISRGEQSAATAVGLVALSWDEVGDIIKRGETECR